ncbi:MAG: hypothetical protein U5K30_00005 [Acidimicrobiales bacterium]|nr:hypothetical protein [Acidimicrobiales bacterium]
MARRVITEGSTLTDAPLLEVEDLCTTFKTETGPVRAATTSSFVLEQRL